MYGCSYKDRHPNRNWDAKRRAEDELARDLRWLESRASEPSKGYVVWDTFEGRGTHTVILCSGEKELSCLSREVRRLKMDDKVLSQIEEWDKEPKANSYAVLLGAVINGCHIRIFRDIPEGWRIK